MAKAKKEEPGQPLPWPADRIILKKVASLVPYARNARVHSVMQVQQFATSIEQFGWILQAQNNEMRMIVAGHCHFAFEQGRNLGLSL